MDERMRDAKTDAFYAWLKTPEGPQPGDGSTVDYGFTYGFKAGVEWARRNHDDVRRQVWQEGHYADPGADNPYEEA